MAVFHLSHHSLRLGSRTVLTDISLTIEAGERVALLGASGAGKSTLLKTLYAQAAAHTALIPQDAALVQSLSVFHNVYMGRLHRHRSAYNLRNLVWPAAAEIAAMTPLLETLGLADLRTRPVGELSGGQAQRVAVARALHQQRDALLGDEPVSAVDAHQAHDMLRLMGARHRTTVLVMHDVDLALAHTDRIVGLADGRIVLDAPSASLDAERLARLYGRAQARDRTPPGRLAPDVRPERESC